MSDPQLCIKQAAPTVTDFASLRLAMGWRNPALPVLQSSIDASLFWVTAYHDKKLVGCGRVVGDGAMYFYLQDVIVHPRHQKQGIGALIMQAVNGFLDTNCSAGSTVGLLAAKGKEAFYLRFGFSIRNGDELGLGMCRFIE